MIRTSIRNLYAYIAVTAIFSVMQGQMAFATEDPFDRFVMNAEPIELPEIELSRLDGESAGIGDYSGQLVVLNFWATWCAPCRHEMPSLDRLQAILGGESLVVVAVATGRNDPVDVERFLQEEEITKLEILMDPKGRLARKMGVLGLPVTAILDRKGQEVGRLVGPADWASNGALQLVAGLLESAGP